MTDDAPPAEAYPYKRAWNYVLWLLGRRAYTRAQLQEKLARKAATPQTIQEVLDRAAELGLYDDQLFAKNFVSSRSHLLGSYRLRQELLRKGVAEEKILEALAGVAEAEQVDAATALLKKQQWRWQGEAHKIRQKAFAYLARRGFSAEVAAQALERANTRSAENP